MNNITQTAISAVNEERELVAIRKAQSIIACIERENNTMEVLRQQIKESQSALSALTGNRLTYEKITGTDRPALPSATQSVVIKAVDGIVESRKECLANSANRLACDIAGKLDAVASVEARIAQLRQELAGLNPDLVSPAQVLG